MRQVTVCNLSNPACQPLQVRYCDSFICQLRGLTFQRQLGAAEGLLLAQRRESRLDAAIHMLGVWFDLAIIWIDSPGMVVDVALARRWRPIYVPKRPARYVLEISPLHLKDYRIGDQIRIAAA